MMKKSKVRWMPVATSLIGILAVCSLAVAQHDGDVFVGRSTAGHLKVGGFIPELNVVGLPCVSGLFQGWSSNNPGFDRVINPDVAADLYPMDTGAQIRIVCVSIDAALRAISPSFTILDMPGESVLLGGSSLHIHLTWHINSADPLFVPTQSDWFAMFKLIDTGPTGYGESAPFTFHFTNGDCPAGDANDDGQMDGRDVQLFATILLDPTSATPRQRCLADCNRDCAVTADDITPFVMRLLGQ